MLDELARFNKERWEALAAAEFFYTRPWLDLDPISARQRVDSQNRLGELAGQQVLCRGGGGGQQSAALALLGAQVTVLDLTDNQLAGDRRAAAHYGLSVHTEQGDMRDLSRFPAASFDLVYHGYSINFVPDPTAVFAQVVQVLRPGGSYFLQWHNPFTHAVDDASWDGTGYRLSRPYQDEEVLPEFFDDPAWSFEDAAGVPQRIQGPREFRHRLSTVVNGLASQHFRIVHCQELMADVPNPVPGSWEHYKQVTAWILELWAVYQP